MTKFEEWLFKRMVEEGLISLSEANSIIELHTKMKARGESIALGISLIKLKVLEYSQLHDFTEQFKNRHKQEEIEQQIEETLNDNGETTSLDINTINSKVFSHNNTNRQSTIQKIIQQDVMFNRYKKIEELGKGSAGIVFLVHDLETEKEVALKILCDEDAINVARFRREAKMIRKLTHANIVNIHDVGEDENVLYLVMQYVPGKSLVEILASQGAMKAREATRITKTIAEVLKYAHINNVLHRDIKPANIIMNDDVPVLTDFGLAREMGKGGALSQSGMIAGTPGYMAPEQIRGKNDDLDGRCDIFALGITYYEMLTGQRAFHSRNQMKILMQVLHESPPDPSTINPSIPEDCERICLKAIAKDPAQRYQTAKSMYNDLEKCLQKLNRRTTGMIQV